MVKVKIIVVLVFTLINCRVYSQEQLLNTPITVSYGRISKYEALKRIGYKLGISFSYKEGLLRNNDIIHIDYKNTLVSEILADIFEEDALDYIGSENIIVIKPSVYPGSVQEPSFIVVNAIPELEIYRITSDSLFSIHKLKLRGINMAFINDSIFHEPEYILSNTQQTIYDNNQVASLSSERKPYFYSSILGTSFNSTTMHGKPAKFKRSNKDMRSAVVLDEDCYDPDEAGGSCDFSSPIISYKTGISVAPHVTFARDTRIKGAVHGGVIQYIWYKNKIGFQTGLQFSSQRTTVYTGYEENEPVSEIITLHYYGIPTCFAYTYFRNDISKHQVSLGLYHYFFSSRQLSINSSKAVEWLQYIDFSYTMELEWFSDFSYFIKPFIRYPLIKSDKYDLLTKTGISLGISYTF